jgi:hypothetical protein
MPSYHVPSEKRVTPYPDFYDISRRRKNGWKEREADD